MTPKLQKVDSGLGLSLTATKKRGEEETKRPEGAIGRRNHKYFDGSKMEHGEHPRKYLLGVDRVGRPTFFVDEPSHALDP